MQTYHARMPLLARLFIISNVPHVFEPAPGPFHISFLLVLCDWFAIHWFATLSLVFILGFSSFTNKLKYFTHLLLLVYSSSLIGLLLHLLSWFITFIFPPTSRLGFNARALSRALVETHKQLRLLWAVNHLAVDTPHHHSSRIDWSSTLSELVLLGETGD